MRVTDGIRTRDIPDHNRVLYLLSYGHHDETVNEIVALPYSQSAAA
jgi:hypothetical protein